MAMKFRLFLSSFVLLSTMFLAGCGHYTCGTTFGNASCNSTGGTHLGSGNPIGVTAFVYFMDDNAAQMAMEGLNVADSGNFAPVPSFVSPVFSLGSGANGGLVVVNKQYLYMPLGNGSVFGFAIDAATGALTAVPGSNTVTGSATTVAADPSGKVLFIGGSSGISAFTINSNDGSLTPTGSFATGGIIPTQLVTDGLGKFVYALTGSTVTAFSYTSSGVLTAIGTPFDISMAQLAAESSGKYMFGITGETGAGSGAVDKTVYIFSITQSGASAGALAAPATGATVSTTYAPIYLTVSPNGKFVYTFNQTNTGTSSSLDPMEGFAFNSSTGALTELSGISPFTGLDAELGRFDQSGQFLFSVASVPSSALAGEFAYSADTTNGALSNTLDHAGVPSLNFAVTDEP